MKDVYRVSVWVPTKKLVFIKATLKAKDALELARSLEPLEVFIEHNDLWYQGGSCCMPVANGTKYNTLDDVLKAKE